jgi:hypothetical protein
MYDNSHQVTHVNWRANLLHLHGKPRFDDIQ